MNQNEEKMEIDLMALVHHLRKKVWIIATVAIVCAIAGLLVSMIFITPQYTASTRMYVLNRTNDNTLGSSDFQSSNYMINDYKELIRGRNVTSEVIKQLGLQMSDGALAAKISVTAPNDTRILQIDVEDSNPIRAAQIANAVREISAQQLKEIMQVDAATKVYDAVVPQKASSPNVTKNALLAGVLGLAVAIAVFVVIYIVDDRIRTEEDVERYLGLSTLGVIPDDSRLDEKPNKAAAPGKAPQKTAKR